MVSSIERFHCIQDSQVGPSGVLYREVPLYTGQPAGSFGYPTTCNSGSLQHVTISSRCRGHVLYVHACGL